MATPSPARIVTVDRLNNGIIIKFDDGRCAFYPSSFLYEKLPECQELDERDKAW